MDENKNLSPAVAAFIGLLVAILAIGLYVTDRDIETQGVTAQEAILNQSISNPLYTELAVRYSDKWDGSFNTTQSAYFFSLRDDPTVQIRMALDERSIDEIAAQFDQEPSTYRNEFDTSQVGQKFTLTEALSPNESITSDFVFVPFDDEHNLTGFLTSPTSNVAQHRKTLDLMLSSVTLSSFDALELTETFTSEANGVEFQYPAEWLVSDTAQTNGTVLTSISGGEESTFQMLMLAFPDEFFQTQGVENSPSGLMQALLANETPDNYIIAPAEITLGEHVGQNAVINVATPDPSLTQIDEYIVIPTNETTQLVVLLRSDSEESLGEIRPTAYDMISSLTVLEAPVDNSEDTDSSTDDTETTDDTSDTQDADSEATEDTSDDNNDSESADTSESTDDTTEDSSTETSEDNTTSDDTSFVDEAEPQQHIFG